MSQDSNQNKPALDFDKAAKQLRNKDWDATAIATIMLVLATFALTIVSSMQVGVSRGQLDALQKQLDEMKIDQRPWVSVKIFIDGWEYVYNGTQWRADVRITYEVTNTGKSPAISVQSRTRIDGTLSPPELIEKQRMLCNTVKQDDHSKQIYGYVLFPNKPIQSPNEVVMWWIDDVQISRSEIPTMYGCIDYRFAGESEHHQTGFMYHITKAGLSPDDFVQFKIDPTERKMPASSLALFPVLDGFFAD